MRKVVSSAGAVAAALLVAGSVTTLGGPASATGSTINLTDDGWGGCVNPANTSVWTSYGSASHIHISDSLYWNSSRSLHINWSDATGELIDCGPGGYRQTGGSVKQVGSWSVKGSHLSSCSFGSSGFNCTINSSDTIASESDVLGPKSNTTGYATQNSGGNNVYASQGGSIDFYNHTGTVSFTYGTVRTTASSSNAADRNV